MEVRGDRIMRQGGRLRNKAQRQYAQMDGMHSK